MLEPINITCRATDVCWVAPGFSAKKCAVGDPTDRSHSRLVVPHREIERPAGKAEGDGKLQGTVLPCLEASHSPRSCEPVKFTCPADQGRRKGLAASRIPTGSPTSSTIAVCYAPTRA